MNRREQSRRRVSQARTREASRNRRSRSRGRSPRRRINQRSASRRQNSRNRSRVATRSRPRVTTRSLSDLDVSRSQEEISIPENRSRVNLMDLDIQPYAYGHIANISVGVIPDGAPGDQPPPPPPVDQPAPDPPASTPDKPDLTWGWNDVLEAAAIFVIVFVILVIVIFVLPPIIDMILKYFGIDVRRAFARWTTG